MYCIVQKEEEEEEEMREIERERSKGDRKVSQSSEGSIRCFCTNSVFAVWDDPNRSMEITIEDTWLLKSLLFSGVM